MNKVPRASLCVTILDDEDYRVLMSKRNGAAAFGVFVAMVILGRERFQQGKARQMSFRQSSVSESLRFDNSTTHLAASTYVSARKLTLSLNVLKEVADETGNEPWMYLDDDSHLVIRSFFKFNTMSGWGGARAGAGRKSSCNQDDSSKNQDFSSAKSSRIYSGTGTGTNSPLPPPERETSSLSSPPLKRGGRERNGTPPKPPGKKPKRQRSKIIDFTDDARDVDT